MTHDKYTYVVFWSEEDQEHVGVALEFRYLSHLDPDAGKALAGIRDLVHMVLRDMAAEGVSAPEPISSRVDSIPEWLLAGRQPATA